MGFSFGSMFSDVGKSLGGGQTGLGSLFGGGSLGGFLGGNGPLADAFGLSNAQGEYFQPQTGNAGLDQLNTENTALAGKDYQQLLGKLHNGTATRADFNKAMGKSQGMLQSGKDAETPLSLSDAMAGLNGAQREGLTTDGILGSRIAANEVAGNPLTKSLFGTGGLSDRLNSEEQRLSSQGYGLQQQDHEAYGQAADDIARMFGQQESDTTAALARRGLGGASSGMSGAAFSGLAGNKNEMLAKAQTDIAQKRMADTNQRVQQARQTMSQLGQLGGALQDSQYERQMSGARNRQQNVTNAAQLQAGANASNNQAGLASMQDKRGAKGKSLLEGLGQGLFSSSQQIGASPGTGASSFSSSFGSALGSGGGMMASDERNKTNVRDGSDDIDEFLDSINSNKYEYRDDAKDLDGAGDGTYVSPMAQELEETPLGRSMVKDTPTGKVVDYGKGFGALLSAVAKEHQEISRLKKGRA